MRLVEAAGGRERAMARLCRGGRLTAHLHRRGALGFAQGGVQGLLLAQPRDLPEAEPYAHPGAHNDQEQHHEERSSHGGSGAARHGGGTHAAGGPEEVAGGVAGGTVTRLSTD